MFFFLVLTIDLFCLRVSINHAIKNGDESWKLDIFLEWMTHRQSIWCHVWLSMVWLYKTKLSSPNASSKLIIFFFPWTIGILISREIRTGNCHLVIETVPTNLNVKWSWRYITYIVRSSSLSLCATRQRVRPEQKRKKEKKKKN